MTEETTQVTPERLSVLWAVSRERDRQDAKWGPQTHLPDGTGFPEQKQLADEARNACQAAAERKEVTWAHILYEEVWEAFAESDIDKLMTELDQVAAVTVAWREALEIRKKALDEKKVREFREASDKYQQNARHGYGGGCLEKNRNRDRRHTLAHSRLHHECGVRKVEAPEDP